MNTPRTASSFSLLALGLAACTGDVGAGSDGPVRDPFATALTYSSSVTVASHADVVAATPPGTDIIDAPPVGFVVGGQRRWLLATVKWFKDPGGNDDFYVYHASLEGSLDRPFQSLRSTRRQWELFSNSSAFPGRWWIVNTYTDGNGVLAFVHVEFADGLTSGGSALRFGRARLGLAWSDDGGDHFRYLGNIVVPENDPADFNVEAAPYLVKDGHLHVYFRDFSGVAVARAQLADVLASARGGGALPAFMKWHDGGWSSPGIGGKATPVGLAGITHSDAAYSTATGRYYLATTTQRSGAAASEISLHESANATQWTLLQTLHPLTDVSLGWQYLSIVDRSGSDNGVVGDRFYIYCGWEPLDAKRSELRRIEVTLGGAPAAPASPTAGYQGTFRVGADLYYSNGSVYCHYATWGDFVCGTGLTSADTVTSFGQIPAGLSPGGACSVPPCAPATPPCVGIFKVGAALHYSNGSTYCYYDTWEHFMCMTGMTDGSSLPSCPETLGQLPNGGVCQVPAQCL